jgi:hypothetical protein
MRWVAALMLCACAREPVARKLPPEPAPTPVASPAPSTTPSTTASTPAPVRHTNGVVIVLESSVAADAKAGALRVVAALGPNDLVGIVAYASDAWVAAKIDSPDADRVEKAVSAITAKPGASLIAGLRLAKSEFASADSLLKHVIVVAAHKGDDGNAEAEVKLMFAQQLELSTFGYGKAVDALALAKLAKLGGGRFHAAQTPAKLEAAMNEEILAVLGP